MQSYLMGLFYDSLGNLFFYFIRSMIVDIFHMQFLNKIYTFLVFLMKKNIGSKLGMSVRMLVAFFLDWNIL